MLALSTISVFFQPLWISSFMEQENKSLSLLGLYSGSHFHRTSVKSYPVLVTNVLKNKDFIDVTLAEEYAFPEVVVTFLFVAADIEVGVVESLSDNCQFGNSYYIRFPFVCSSHEFLLLLSGPMCLWQCF